MSLLPVCSLCLFKIEIVDDEVELCENTENLKEILNDLFCDKINLPESSLQYVCRSCCEKLESFHEYFLFVLKNQSLKEEQKQVLEADSEFVNVKVEPDFAENKEKLIKNTEENSQKRLRRGQNVKKSSSESLLQRNEVYQTITEFYEMTCDACQTLFESYPSLIRHCRKEHGSLRVWFCCNSRLYTTTKLFEHANSHKNPNKCRHCGEKFIESKALRQHKCPFRKYVTCNECGRQFKQKNMLRDHLKIHFPEYIYCELCGKSFTKKHKFREHMSYDHGNMPQEEMFKPCPICGKLVSTRNYGMKDHIRERHEKVATGPLKCEQCGKEYSNEKNLKRHVREEHTFGRKFQCQHCDKRFLRAKALKEHEAIHTGHPIYVCEYCDAPFKSNGNYYSHKRRLHPVEYAEQKANRKAVSAKKCFDVDQKL
ncbi:zinc finger protein 93-like [Culicoides brevitarsis]|uniref:zinc finger protein 93-like n=1 Tax=Culicoides brevitarsis TaxID=469753 RepID=UPI00307CC010